MIDPGRGTDIAASAIRETMTYKQICGHCIAVARDPGAYGVLSTGERYAVSLVLNRPSMAAPETILDTVQRLGEDWLMVATLVHRDGWDHGAHHWSPLVVLENLKYFREQEAALRAKSQR